jgi:Shikimate kinase
MKQFYLLTGPMGVGKTTIGKCLCDKLGKSAFIDGDWCLDIHPFVGNKETKNMAINNIIYLVKNYLKCSECDSIVLSWVMSDSTIRRIVEGISSCDLKIYSITLICSERALRERWNNDTIAEWRNEEELQNSLLSLNDYKHRQDTCLIDSSDMRIESVVNRIIKISR